MLTKRKKKWMNPGRPSYLYSSNINTYNWELGSKHMSVFPLGDKTTASL